MFKSSLLKTVCYVVPLILVGCGGDDNSDAGGGSSPPSVDFVIASTSLIGKGVVSPNSQRVAIGAIANFNISPADGHHIASASGCDGVLSGNFFSTAAMTDSCTVTIVFEPDEFPETSISNAERAIKFEDHRLATDVELLTYAKAKLGSGSSPELLGHLVSRLYDGIDQITWDPTLDGLRFTSFDSSRTFGILPVNRKKEQVINPGSDGHLLVASSMANSNVLVMASSLFGYHTNEQTDKLLNNIINWLTDGKARDGKSLSIVGAHLRGSDYQWFPFHKHVTQWFDKFYPDSYKLNPEYSCNYDALLTCITEKKPDLLIVGNDDPEGRGYASIKESIELASQSGIPIIFMNHKRSVEPILTPIYSRLGITARSVEGHHTEQLSVADIMDTYTDGNAAILTGFLDSLLNQSFDISVMDECKTAYFNCKETDFSASFGDPGRYVNNILADIDKSGLDIFSLFEDELAWLKAMLLVADKYRSEIDYPISRSEPTAWQRALFSDWTVSYLRNKNIAQPDLGYFVAKEKDLKKGSPAHYQHPETVDDSLHLDARDSKGATTGWYALPGQKITMSRGDSNGVIATIKLNYHSDNYSRTFESNNINLSVPTRLRSQVINLSPGETVSFSSPYGGPIYVVLSEEDIGDGVILNAHNVAKHAAITDFNSSEQIAKFLTMLSQTELPHVDLKNKNIDYHMRRDYFEDAVPKNAPDIESLLSYIVNDHVNTVYTLAGLAVPGKTLQESLPKEVLKICSDLFGVEDCIDTKLHSRDFIQHATFDQYSACGSACSGNPFSSSAPISPIGWGPNHELGHNLQTKKLNVAYVEEKEKDSWGKYENRSNETSNNIFPYYVQWRAHFIRDGKSEPLTSQGANHKDLFYAFVSDAEKLTGSDGSRIVFDHECNVMGQGSRYDGPWSSSAYTIHNSYRFSFYVQMALQADKMHMHNGDVLANGFDIYTLLYQYARVFDKYAKDESTWMSNRDRLGFGLFPYSGLPLYSGGTISDIVGNDFLLLALSQLTRTDWRPQFDIHGIRYSGLAASQLDSNKKYETWSLLPYGMYELENDTPNLEMSNALKFISFSDTMGVGMKWKDGSSPLQCKKN